MLKNISLKRKCLIISTEPIYAPARGLKGKLKESDRVRMKEVDPVGGLADR